MIIITRDSVFAVYFSLLRAQHVKLHFTLSFLRLFVSRLISLRVFHSLSRALKPLRHCCTERHLLGYSKFINVDCVTRPNCIMYLHTYYHLIKLLTAPIVLETRIYTSSSY